MGEAAATLVTGGAGKIGAWIVPALAANGPVRVLDRVRPRDPPEPSVRLEVVEGDAGDPSALADAVAGCGAVVHLAAIPDEAPLADLLAANVLTTGAVLETARRSGVQRVVLASSNRLTGCYERGRTVQTADPPRPDTFYGVSKVAVEALGRLYVDRWGMDVVCVRIGTAALAPLTERDLSTWVSPGDLGRCFVAAVHAPHRGFGVVYAVSANARSWWAPGSGPGYEAIDDAEAFAAMVGPDDPDADPNRQGLLRPWPA